MKTSYIVIPLLGLAIALVKNIFTEQGVIWRESLLLPSWSPSPAITGDLSGIAFVLFLAAAVLVWEGSRRKGRVYLMSFLALAALLDAVQSYLFFVPHLLTGALIARILTCLAVLAVAVAMFRLNRWATALLLIYSAWMVFLSFLTYSIISLNST